MKSQDKPRPQSASPTQTASARSGYKAKSSPKLSMREMAQSLDSTSTESLNATQKRLESDYRKLSESLDSSLKSVQRRLEAGTREAVTTWRRPWLIHGAVILTLLCLSWGVTAVLSSKIASQTAALISLNQAKKSTFNIGFIEDQNGQFIVLPEGYSLQTGWTSSSGKPTLKLIKD